MIELIGAVDLQKYSGQWLEMARKPAFFQKACVASKANYTLEFKDGKPILSVENSCFKENGEQKVSKGSAKVKGERALAVKFSVFMNLFDKTNYEIIYIDTNYQVALVGSPDKEYLWILSREILPKEQVENLLHIAKERGFDTSDIIFDKHKSTDFAPKETQSKE